MLTRRLSCMRRAENIPARVYEKSGEYTREVLQIYGKI